MRKVLGAMLLCLSSFSFLNAEDNSFLGVWKLNPAKSKLTDVMKVQRIGKEVYAFNFGGGPETIKVNGTDQPGGFGTTLSIAMEAPQTWKVVRKKDGRTQIVAIWNLASDDTALTDHFTGFNPDGSKFKLDYLYKRHGQGSGFEGEWVSTSESAGSPVTLTIRPFQTDGLSFSDSSTQTTRAGKVDGKEYPNSGPNALTGSTSSFTRRDERVVETAYKVKGRLLYTQTIQLSPDLKTLTMIRRIVGESETNVQVFDKN